MIGIIGKKCGMTRVFSDDGRSVPVTVIQANPNRINSIKSSEIDGYKAIQVTAGQAKSKTNKPIQGQYAKVILIRELSFMSLSLMIMKLGKLNQVKRSQLVTLKKENSLMLLEKQ